MNAILINGGIQKRAVSLVLIVAIVMYSNFTIISRTILTKILVRTQSAAYNQVWLIYGQKTKSCQHPEVRPIIGAAYNCEITVHLNFSDYISQTTRDILCK